MPAVRKNLESLEFDGFVAKIFEDYFAPQALVVEYFVVGVAADWGLLRVEER